MSTPKHTPGPWQVEHNHTTEIWNQNTHICTLSGDHEPHTEVNDETNAQLIAAAPEMLWALQAYFDHIVHKNQGFTREEIEAEMRAAIAKATGGA